MSMGLHTFQHSNHMTLKGVPLTTYNVSHIHIMSERLILWYSSV
jgi:hypothetical protein